MEVDKLIKPILDKITSSEFRDGKLTKISLTLCLYEYHAYKHLFSQKKLKKAGVASFDVEFPVKEIVGVNYLPQIIRTGDVNITLAS